MSKETVPQKLRIGSYTYKIKTFDHVDGEIFEIYGLHAPGSLQIRYQDSIPDQKKAYVLMHEALHGIFHVSSMLGSDKDEIEEELVTKLAEELNEFILNNPKFIAWISQTLSDDESRYHLEVVDHKKPEILPLVEMSKHSKPSKHA